MNVFEGARRLALLASMLAVIGAITGIALTSPSPRVEYDIVALGAQPTPSAERCELHDHAVYLQSSITGGRTASVTACLRAIPFGPDGTLLVPYKRDPDGTVWGAPSYSREVIAYSEQIAASFQIPAQDQYALEDQFKADRLRHWATASLATILCLAVFWLLVWATGWVVRGFAGIPAGQDKKSG